MRRARHAPRAGRTFPAGVSYVVPLDQAQYRMIRGIFDRVTEFEENIFYDVSGWTMPLPMTWTTPRSRMRGWATALKALADGAFAAAPALPDRASYGYVFDWSHTYAPRALNRIARRRLDGAGVA
jgi:hypothetical protein